MIRINIATGSSILFMLAACAAAVPSPMERNLVYRSPFTDHPQFARDTHEIQKRHVKSFQKRQALGPVASATPFKDDHYPTFYGGNFAESAFVWSGGIKFTHEVASGDPFDKSLLLWTRAVPSGFAAGEESTTPTSNSVIPSIDIPVCVAFALSKSPTLAGKPLKSGTAFTSVDVDWTVKVEVDGLKPDTSYFYRFSDCTNPSSVSTIGKTRTLASPNTPAHKVNGGKPLTLAVFSCSQFQTGWFNAYGFAAHNTSADVFIHLGDYIYENVDGGLPGIGRNVDGRELATIHDYRQRLAQYRTDTSLLAAHTSGPWITVWDDHEVADQAWKAGTANANDSFVGSPSGCVFSPSGACFTDRKLAAVRAYHEWLPIRQVQADDLLRIWRNFQIGKLLDLTMLDTRNYDRDITDLYYNTEYVNTLADLPGRSLMGPQQESWLFDTLDQSVERGAIWRVIGQQIVFSQLNEGGAFDLDAWDGYRQNRMRVLDHLFSRKISNTIILSGDSHANWVSDLAHPNDTTTYNPTTGKGAIGVEFAGTAVTSPSSFGTSIGPAAADTISTELLMLDGNEDLQWTEGSFRGFFTLTITPDVLNATYFAMQNISNPNLQGFASANFVVKAGANKLNRPVAGGSVKAGVLRSSVHGST